MPRLTGLINCESVTEGSAVVFVGGGVTTPESLEFPLEPVEMYPDITLVRSWSTNFDPESEPDPAS